jgi:hypothetical protein
MGQLDNTRMGKLARDCGIIGTYAKAPGEIDVVYAKVGHAPFPSSRTCT